MMRAVRRWLPAFLLIAACGRSIDLAADRAARDRVLADQRRDLAGPCGGENCGPGKLCIGRECVDELAVWPNRESWACSDPWLALHHRELRQLRPRVLALNFVNAKSNAQMLSHLQAIVAALAEASRARGYANADAPSQLRLQIAYAIDLRDHPPPRDWPWSNSTHYPRENPRQGTWGFDYGALFTAAFAEKLGIADPADPTKKLDLCQLIERGLVHEVWVYGDGDKPDAGAAEILEQKPFYTIARARDPGKPSSRCAGNGCFDADDPIPSGCKRSVRIGWVNHSRGPGCFLESLAHGFEQLANHRPPLIPYLAAHFPGFAGFDLERRYKLRFSSWYFCPFNVDCLSYPTPSSVSYQVGAEKGTIQSYDPVCGNVHFPPNARRHYDLDNPQPVLSSCESYATGVGGKQEFTIARFAPYQTLGQDCMGAFLVYFWQNVPGHDAKAIGLDGKPMLSWWPFIYY
jgi:hypothetical protein